MSRHAVHLPLVAALCSVALLFSFAGSAPGVTIGAPYTGPPLPGPIMTGLSSSTDLAVGTLESIFSDDVVLHFEITSTSLGPGVLGYFDIDPVTSPFSYGMVAGALGGDATSPDDFTAVSSLQPGPALYMITNDTTSAPSFRTFYSTSETFNTTLRLSRAQQKALGLLAPTDGGPGADGTIVLNDLMFPAMDFDPGDGIGPGMFDMTAILMHEMMHGMGFISGVDHIDYSGSDGVTPPPGDFPHDYTGETIFTVLDLYRYSMESKDFITQPGAGTTLDWAAGTSPIFGDNPYFSIDGGDTPLAPFSTGAYFGDGFQAQHWKDSSFVGPPLGLLDPDIDTAELGIISPLDVLALDAVGWDIVVPEPSSFTLAGMGLATLLVLGGRRWRRV